LDKIHEAAVVTGVAAVFEEVEEAVVIVEASEEVVVAVEASEEAEEAVVIAEAFEEAEAAVAIVVDEVRSLFEHKLRQCI
jgi:hypothetical protein